MCLNIFTPQAVIFFFWHYLPLHRVLLPKLQGVPHDLGIWFECGPASRLFIPNNKAMAFRLLFSFLPQALPSLGHLQLFLRPPPSSPLRGLLAATYQVSLDSHAFQSTFQLLEVWVWLWDFGGWPAQCLSFSILKMKDRKLS